MRNILLLILFVSVHTLQAAERLVIAGGSLTEIVYALDRGEQVVGVDMSSTYPASVKNLPQIGYWRQLNSEGIISLQPDMFITWQDAGPEIVINQLEQNGINVVKLQRTPGTPQQLYHNITMLADKLDKKVAGEQLINAIKQQLAKVEIALSNQVKQPSVLFILTIANEAAQIAGKNTVADSIIGLAGGNNVATHQQYQKYGGESIVALNPDIIIVTTESLGGDKTFDNVKAIAGVTETAAWKNQRIVTIEHGLILGMTPRLGDAVETLHQGFYPEK